MRSDPHPPHTERDGKGVDPRKRSAGSRIWVENENFNFFWYSELEKWR